MATTDSVNKINDKWEIFQKKGLHFLHLNVNSLLPKIEEIRFIAQKTRASIIGITETKLDSSITTGEVEIEGYDMLRLDRTRHGGGVACYIKNSISYNYKPNLCKDIESIFLDIYIPKSNPILIGIFHSDSLAAKLQF